MECPSLSRELAPLSRVPAMPAQRMAREMQCAQPSRNVSSMTVLAAESSPDADAGVRNRNPNDISLNPLHPSF